MTSLLEKFDSLQKGVLRFLESNKGKVLEIIDEAHELLRTCPSTDEDLLKQCHVRVTSMTGIYKLQYGENYIPVDLR